MARFEILDGTAAPLGEGPAAGDMLFELGMMYSVGRDMPIDLVSAHKWFNLAAVKGNREAIRLRREIADQMSESEIAAAQRAARDWLKGGGGSPARKVWPQAMQRVRWPRSSSAACTLQPHAGHAINSGMDLRARRVRRDRGAWGNIHSRGSIA